jgi:hypothetical protein
MPSYVMPSYVGLNNLVLALITEIVIYLFMLTWYLRFRSMTPVVCNRTLSNDVKP